MVSAREERMKDRKATLFGTGTAWTKWSSQFAKAKAGKGDNDCWEWQGVVSDRGYGKFGQRYAHRVAYELLIGFITPEMYVLHSCDNPVCINPVHLRTGDALRNSQDAVERGRTAAGVKNGRAKLTENDVLEIRKLRGKVTVSELVSRFGVSQATISNIHTGKTWKVLGG